MKTKLITLLLLVTLSSVGQKTVNIPYFGKIKSEILCGTPAGCQPTSSTYFAPVKNKIYYGYPKYDLFRIVTKEIYASEPCGGPVLTETSVVTARDIDIELDVMESKKNDFSAELVANIMKLLKEKIPTIDSSLKVNLAASFSTTVKSELNKKIQVNFKVMDLHPQFIDDNIYVNNCKNAIKKDWISTGISVATIKGSWTSAVIKNLLATFEASAAYTSNASAKIKEDFEKVKEVLMKGEVKEFSVITAVAYRKANIK